MGVKFSDKTAITDAGISNSGSIIPIETSDVVNKITPAQLRMQAVAVSSDSAGTVSKTATVNNMSDFVLKNGMLVTVYFQNGNTADTPSLNVNGTGSYPLRLENQASTVTIGSGCWGDGALLTAQYVAVGDNAYWLLLGHNVAQVTNDYTIMADGRIRQWYEVQTEKESSWRTKTIYFSKSFSSGNYSVSITPAIYDSNDPYTTVCYTGKTETSITIYSKYVRTFTLIVEGY